MIYLKKFNESQKGFEYELKTFCSEYLSYLLDNEDITLELYNDEGDDYIELSISIIDDWIYLSNIMYILMPFFEILIDTYTLLTFKSYGRPNVKENSIMVISDIDGKHDYYTKEDILKEDIQDCILNCIELKIKIT